MARIAVIAAALVRVAWRDVRSLGSLAANNFLLLLLVITYEQPESSAFLFALLGLTLLFPMSSDALGKFPPERFALWPLNVAARLSVRGISLLLNPLLWIAAAIWASTGRFALGLEFFLILIICQAAMFALEQFAARHPQRNLLRVIPAGNGWLGGLLAKDLRQLLITLDPYPVVLLAAGAALYRIVSAAPDPGAYSVLSVIVAVGLSTYAQSLFGLDGASGLARYRLLPLRGWQILFSKGIALLGLLFVLVLPLQPGAGLAAGLVALAVGQHSSVLHPVPQRKWRFTSGRIWPIGFLQLVGMVSIGSAVRANRLWFLLAVAIYAVSLLFYGKTWDRRILGST